MGHFYPLSLRLTSADEIFQLRFAREAAETLAASDLLQDIDFETSGEGFVLFAETEEDFVPIIDVLQEQYSEALLVGPVRVRYRWAPMLLEPVMAVRVNLSDQHYHLVTSHLLARGANILACKPEATEYDIYATAPLTRILGIRCELQALCEGTCQMELQLFGYFSPEPTQGPYDYAG